MRVIWLFVAPRYDSVTASFFFSMISMEREEMMLKHATIRMNVRKT